MSNALPQFKFAWLWPRYWLVWLGIATLFFLAHTPRFIKIWMAKLIAALIMCSKVKRFTIAALNIHLCFPGLSLEQQKALVKKHLQYQALILLDYGLFWHGSKQFLQKNIILEGREYLEQALAQEKSIIILTVHGTAVDVGALIISSYYALSGMYNSFANPIIDWWMAKGRMRFANWGDGFARDGGLKHFIKFLNAKVPVYYIPDEDLGKESSIFQPFFKFNKASVAILGKLAKKHDSIILPCINYYDNQEHKYYTRLYPALENFPKNNKDQDTLAINQAMEKIILEYPEQYMWSQRLFFTSPKGRSIYQNKTLLARAYRLFCG